MKRSIRTSASLLFIASLFTLASCSNSATSTPVEKETKTKKFKLDPSLLCPAMERICDNGQSGKLEFKGKTCRMSCPEDADTL